MEALLIGTPAGPQTILWKTIGVFFGCPIDPRVSPKRAVSSPPAEEGASSKREATHQQRAEPGGAQDAQPIIKFVTPGNAAYLCAKTPILPHLDRLRWRQSDEI